MKKNTPVTKFYLDKKRKVICVKEDAEEIPPEKLKNWAKVVQLETDENDLEVISETWAVPLSELPEDQQAKIRKKLESARS